MMVETCPRVCYLAVAWCLALCPTARAVRRRELTEWILCIILDNNVHVDTIINTVYTVCVVCSQHTHTTHFCMHAGSHMQHKLLQGYAVTDLISSQLQHYTCTGRDICQKVAGAGTCAMQPSVVTILSDIDAQHGHEVECNMELTQPHVCIICSRTYPGMLCTVQILPVCCWQSPQQQQHT